TPQYIARRMLVILTAPKIVRLNEAIVQEIGLSPTRIGKKLRHRMKFKRVLQHMRHRQRLRHVAVVDRPALPRTLQLVVNSHLVVQVQTWMEDSFRHAYMAQRRAAVHKETVRPRRSRHRTEPAI